MFSAPISSIFLHGPQSLVWTHKINLTQDGQEKCCSFPRPCLGTDRQVILLFDNRNSMLLHWSWVSITSKLNVSHNNYSHLTSLKLSLCEGPLLPVASTGMSSYFSKLTPVLPPVNAGVQLQQPGIQLEEANGVGDETASHFSFGLPVYSKFKILFYTFSKTLGQRFDTFSSPSPKSLLLFRVPASVILSESALSSIIYFF